ncbi:MAG: bifunctional riboflavin kinase/FAD synthetase [Methylacidiphilales bacterium]|nr:bifunctional riboflavin kinase/FAD synthetase [Candidatus Methylacidiphilales bacterium]
MNVFESLYEARSHGGIQALALGFFDGLHLGHQRVIKNAALDQPPESSCVLTFRVHPQSVLFPEKAPPLLMGLPHKLKALEEAGVHNVLALPFDERTIHTPAEDFLEALETSFPGLKRIAVGPNWRFGYKRLGDIPLLRQWCDTRRNKIELLLAEPARHAGAIISSSRIRASVLNGNLAEASEMLGRPYGLFGTVTRGKGLGKQLGFPTLNLETQDQCFPPSGVYFGVVQLQPSENLPAAINIGIKPTIGSGGPPQAEAHILDFNANLYGKSVLVCPLQFQRAEKKFDSLDALKLQVQQDLAAARAWVCR